METFLCNAQASHKLSPHSLGKLIEWKHRFYNFGRCVVSIPPHSLGKLIEWKLLKDSELVWTEKSPHSLGKLIEWKQIYSVDAQYFRHQPPHSLGKLIEWKLNSRNLGVP